MVSDLAGYKNNQKLNFGLAFFVLKKYYILGFKNVI
jgi:hypothetical protein